METGDRRPTSDTGLCPHGNFPPCELCLNEALAPGLAAREGWQRSEEDRVGEVEGFAPDLAVGYGLSMGEDRRAEGKSRYGQDMVLADKESGVAAALDGMGGEGEKASGSRASAYAAERFPSLYRESAERLDKTPDMQNAATALLEAKRMTEGMSEEEVRAWWDAQPAEARNEALRLFETVRSLSSEVASKTEGKTTFVGGKAVETGGRRYEVIVSVGDSVAVRRGADGKIEPVSVEDSAFEMMQARGMLPKEGVTDETVEKVTRGKFKSVKDLRRATTQSLGAGKVMPHVSFVPVEDGDRIVYMTDGLVKGFSRPDGTLDAERLSDLLSDDPESGEAARRIVEAAKAGQRETGAFDDNGVIVKDYTPEAEIAG